MNISEPVLFHGNRNQWCNTEFQSRLAWPNGHHRHIVFVVCLIKIPDPTAVWCRHETNSYRDVHCIDIKYAPFPCLIVRIRFLRKTALEENSFLPVWRQKVTQIVYLIYLSSGQCQDKTILLSWYILFSVKKLLCWYHAHWIFAKPY